MYKFAYQFYGLLLNFDWLIKMSVQKFQPLILLYKMDLNEIIGFEIQFMGHYLIPLDP